jgi:hypothetical protein
MLSHHRRRLSAAAQEQTQRAEHANGVQLGVYMDGWMVTDRWVKLQVVFASTLTNKGTVKP